MTACDCGGPRCVLTADDPRHGTANGYSNLGCRCVPCGRASRVVWRERIARARRTRTCPNCGGPGGLLADGECSACEHYRRVHGRVRPPEVYDPAPIVPRSRRTCGNCGRRGVHATGRCMACHRYVLRNDRERPAKLYEASS